VTLEFSEQHIPLDFHWSPDGQRIVYLIIFGGQYYHYVYEFFERRLIPLNIDSSLGVLPSWSPDSQQLAYGSTVGGLCILRLQSMATDCVRTSSARFAAWSPDGRRIAYYGDDGMHLMAFDLQTGTNKVLVPGLEVLVPAPLFWSPDGRMLIFQRRLPPSQFAVFSGLPRTDLMLIEYPANGMYRYHPPDNLTSKVIADSGSAIGYRWSPDSQQFAYTAYIRAIREIAQHAVYDLFVYTRPENTHRRITQDDAEELDPSWSPDGRWFAYIASLNGMATLVLRDTANDYDVIDSTLISSYNLDWRP
jgi:molecular chaperone DnaK